MKPGLGDDPEDGWLLLGGPGGSVGGGSTAAVRFDGGASLAAQQVLSVAAAGVALSIAAGSAPGGRPTGSSFFSQPLR